MRALPGRTATTLMLGVAQTLAWASSYYLPAVLAGPIGAELDVSPSTIFGAFSVALLVSAATGPWAGRAIDRFGGRPVLVASNLMFAAGLTSLALSSHVIHVFAAWVLLGAGMGSGLYEAAFATAVRLHGRDARGVITGVTLLGGLASTVGWPLSALLEEAAGWRGACLAWAGLHLVLGLPLNALLPPPPSAHAVQAEDGKAERGRAAALTAAEQRRAGWIMAYVFAVSWFVSTAMAAHLPRLLVAGGATLALAVSIAALVGPAQVVGRLIEFSLLKRAHPLLSARLATLAHPLGALCLGLFGMQAATAFAVLHGLGNGILTIAIGTLPLLVFGPQGYGQRQGLLMVPARIVQAGAPFLFGLALERWGAGALWLSAGLGLSACAALLAMKLSLVSTGHPADSAPLEDAAGRR